MIFVYHFYSHDFKFFYVFFYKFVKFLMLLFLILVVLHLITYFHFLFIKRNFFDLQISFYFAQNDLNQQTHYLFNYLINFFDFIYAICLFIIFPHNFLVY